MRSNKRRLLLHNTAAYCVLIAASLTVVIPILWMFSTAIKPMDEIFTTPPKWFSKRSTLDSFARMLSDYSFARYFANSFFVVCTSTAVSLFFSTLAAYGTSRFSFRGKSSFLTFLLVSQMFPSIMLLIPFYKIIRSAGLINTHSGLMLTYVSFTIPLCAWMMKSYFDSIPKDLDAAANIDGCGKFRTFAVIILPLALPGLVATAIYSFITGWNEYLFAVIILSSDSLKTIPIGIGELMGQNNIAWNDLMAASLVASIPLSVFFLILQKYLVSGLTAGSIK